MRALVSANVNGLRAAVRRGAVRWLAAVDADVYCLQEVRASEPQLVAALTGTPFEHWHAAHAPALLPGRAGVAVLSRFAAAGLRVGLPGFPDAGRWVEMDVVSGHGLVTVVSAYVPTGEAATPRQAEKFAFLDAMSARMAELSARAATGRGEAVITGDFNVAHREADLKNWKGNLGKAGFLPAERAYLDRWAESGWTDLGRHHGGEGAGPYTWWSWRGKAFDNDTGWRIDYQLATRGLTARSVKAEVGRAASYAERWSDHAPLTVWFA